MPPHTEVRHAQSNPSHTLATAVRGNRGVGSDPGRDRRGRARVRGARRECRGQRAGRRSGDHTHRPAGSRSKSRVLGCTRRVRRTGQPGHARPGREGSEWLRLRARSRRSRTGRSRWSRSRIRAVSITAINGSQLSLKTDDGWTRTIDAAGATVTEQGGTAITLADLKVGDQIAFRQTRNADGTYTVTQIVRIPPQASGTVKSVDANSATLTLPDGTTKTIGLTSSTTYTLNGNAATAADLKVGTRVHATGTVDANGNFTATKVAIAPAEVHGTVTAKSGNTITLKDQAGASVTVNVDGSTTYASRGSNAAGLADIAVGDVLEAEGTLNADGSLTARRVQYGTPARAASAAQASAAQASPGPGGHRGPGGNGNGNGPPRTPTRLRAPAAADRHFGPSLRRRRVLPRRRRAV